MYLISILYNRMKLRGLSFFIGTVIVLFAFKMWAEKLEESFWGTSPGTMDQLSSTHVPTAEDADYYQNIYPRIIRRDLKDMTGEDPGMILPWHFPWFGRGAYLMAN